MKPVTPVAHSLWDVIITSSVLSKIILVGASIVLILCFFIFIYKMLVLQEKRRRLARAMESLQEASSFNELLNLGATLGGTAAGWLISYGLKAVKAILQHGGEAKTKMSAAEAVIFQEVMEQGVGEIAHKEYAYLPVLSVSAAVAPLVGLFGTISGLIQAFIVVGQERSTDITAIAPGIAEALITTFAGLVVAIPAFVMYHYLLNAVRDFERQLVAFEYQFEWFVKRLLVE
ncbi:MAG: MotA/TolQ/ExbB proton channel family protein [Candidatus Babeliaceae bacterium]|nr:MotA/TolQ/ExbB proton channel family protein [Candidatus Babeliaceae bacterium]